MAEGRMDETRRVAHRLLDELPDRLVLAAKDAIAALKAEAAKDYFEVLKGAAEDDEGVTAQDLDALGRARKEHGRGESRLWHDSNAAHRSAAPR